MSSIVNKVKEALHGDKHDNTHDNTTHTGTTGTHNTTGTREGEHGPHSSRAANAADPRVDSDRDGSHNVGQAGYGSATGGYMHGTAHGAGPEHTSHGTTGHTGSSGLGTGGYSSGTREGEHGPHGNRAANALDPRVDSDRDGSHNTGVTGGGLTGTHHTNTAGTTGGYGSSTGAGYGSTGTREGEHGPHSSRIANAADPRVDSDRDGSHNTRTGGGLTGTHHTNTAGSGLTGTTGNYGSSGTTGAYGSSGTREGEHGPHSSRIANAADPRVDSDRDGSHNTGAYGSSNTGAYGSSGTTGSGFTGSTATHREGEHGPHSTRTANALDPRVDSDRDGSHNTGTFGTTGHSGVQTGYGVGGAGSNTSGTTGYGSNTANTGAYGSSGPGPAPNTAGPHKSDMVNKLDPRVDSDLDNSKTIGGNKTYQSGTHDSSLANKDPRDAAQVPPSVLQQTIGAPVIAHDDHHHGRERRNSTATHQEAHRGI
jgi:hypothetical protein